MIPNTAVLDQLPLLLDHHSFERMTFTLFLSDRRSGIVRDDGVPLVLSGRKQIEGFFRFYLVPYHMYAR
jgi:hypothetical protein